MDNTINQNFKLNKHPHSIYLDDALYNEIANAPVEGKSFSNKVNKILYDYVNGNKKDKFARRKKKNQKDVIKFIDLFAGIGGIRLGFQGETNDTKCVYSSEWDKFAQKTYEANFGDVPQGDITKVNAEDIPSFDVLLGGFPCQPFSSIGKREGFANKTQGTLFFDVLRILKYHMPKAFLLENVPGLLTIQNGETFKTILAALNEAGYDVSDAVLNAADFGLAQERKRVIMVGFRKDLHVENFSFPKGTKKDVYIDSVLEDSPIGYSVSKKLQQNYLFKKDDGRPFLVNKNSKKKAKTINASYHKIQRLTGTFVEDGETGIRLLSQTECLRLQGFPDQFKIPVSRTQMYRQMGNSVAVPVIKAVSKNIKEILHDIACNEEPVQLDLI
ncbi:DNA cytosine methyltransferase [Pediococcus pentosaceus]|jgi:DNA (cytosine-5)-methyltransferase 1|uniref:DNA cytosine methyltransferase n=1 Tax=Pediococcus pentosaceus TaxID=1255 RepID=UPI00235DD66C|nr:DNA cytosine methyltransferase [Pediococcus pentosaceus]MDD1387002.1 DNA cytosine methyltransferase [Pediococcus pentosaceus]